MFYLIKAPWVLRKVYSECIWKIPTEEKILYLTFDDGPHPEATPFVLKELENYQAKATFFCIGEQVVKHPMVYNQILEAGHLTGNHTYHHLNGWKTPDKEYLEDVAKAALHIDSRLFRPPYGRISKFQLSALRGAKFNFTPIMWDVLSADFDTSIKSENCYLNVVKHAGPGSLVVFHDSLKALPHLTHTLPRVLEHYAREGYRFESIPASVHTDASH